MFYFQDHTGDSGGATSLIVGLVLSAIVLMAVLTGVAWCYCKRKQQELSTVHHAAVNGKSEMMVVCLFYII